MCLRSYSRTLNLDRISSCMFASNIMMAASHVNNLHVLHPPVIPASAKLSSAVIEQLSASSCGRANFGRRREALHVAATPGTFKQQLRSWRKSCLALVLLLVSFGRAHTTLPRSSALE